MKNNNYFKFKTQQCKKVVLTLITGLKKKKFDVYIIISQDYFSGKKYNDIGKYLYKQWLINI
jgi:hypothetical protein